MSIHDSRKLTMTEVFYKVQHKISCIVWQNGWKKSEIDRCSYMGGEEHTPAKTLPEAKQLTAHCIQESKLHPNL